MQTQLFPYDFELPAPLHGCEYASLFTDEDDVYLAKTPQGHWRLVKIQDIDCPADASGVSTNATGNSVSFAQAIEIIMDYARATFNHEIILSRGLTLTASDMQVSIYKRQDAETGKMLLRAKSSLDAVVLDTWPQTFDEMASLLSKTAADRFRMDIQGYPYLCS